MSLLCCRIMKIKFFLPAIAWFVVSTLLLVLPGDDLPSTSFLNFPHFDKIVHLGLFFGLTFLFSIPFRLSKFSSLKNYIIILIISILYGIMIEYVQLYWVKDRNFDVADIFFDGAGSIIGFIVVWLYKEKK